VVDPLPGVLSSELGELHLETPGIRWELIRPHRPTWSLAKGGQDRVRDAKTTMLSR
jgi:hypothetical protein